jgi:hypothetical protein
MIYATPDKGQQYVNIIMMDDEFITEEQLEKRINCPKGSLRNMRYRGINLPHTKIGKRHIRYHWPTVKNYLLGENNQIIPVTLAAKPLLLTSTKPKTRRGRPRKMAPVTNPSALPSLPPADAYNV